MRNTNWKLKLYNATWYRFHFYIIGILLIMIPIIIVEIDRNFLPRFVGDLALPVSFSLFIIGRTLSIYKKSVDTETGFLVNTSTLLGMIVVFIIMVTRKQ